MSLSDPLAAAPVYSTRVISNAGEVVTIEIGFGQPATNRELVPGSIAALRALQLPGGKGIRFNGPASVPVVSALTHAVAHLYGYVAWFDPKLQGYVVAVSHDPDTRPGDVLLS